MWFIIVDNALTLTCRSYIMGSIGTNFVLAPSIGPIWSTVPRPGAPSTGRMWSSCSGSRGGPLRWSEDCSTSPMRKGWGNWACLAWRGEVSGKTSLQPSSTWREHINSRGNGCLRGWIVIGQGGMVLNWDKGGLGWILERSFSHRGWWRTGTDFPRRLWMPHPWRHSRPGWMWFWAAWFSGWRPCT